MEADQVIETIFDGEPHLVLDQPKPVICKRNVGGHYGWFAQHPDPCPVNALLLIGPRPPGAGHHVEEHEDGHITVRPNPPGDPGNSNSILCECGWHGYIDHGRWYTV